MTNCRESDLSDNLNDTYAKFYTSSQHLPLAIKKEDLLSSNTKHKWSLKVSDDGAL
jgi:hypothetical protein